jgi:hypothetical protein
VRASVRIGALLALAAAIACDHAPATAPVSVAARGKVAVLDDNMDPQSFAFAPGALPYGQTMIHWSQHWWQWAYSIPATANPLIDGVGQDCVNGQQGTVWYLAVLVQGSGTRSCTIPRHRALVINLSGVLNDYPCPDPTFKPAPGQTLYQFLIQGAAPIVNAAFGITLTVDGRSLANPMSYRFTSPQLFYITGDPSLQATLDPCIIGTPQPAISDGYFVVLKPLAPGNHVVTFAAKDPSHSTSVTWNLTVKNQD